VEHISEGEMPLAALAGIGIAGSIGGAAISAHASGQAADAQAAAADRSAQLQYQASQDALNFQKQQYAQSQANAAPWLQSGTAGLSNLDYLLGIKPPTTQGAMTGTTGAAGSPAQNASLTPRYLNDTYNGSISGSDSGSQWKFAGQHDGQDIYERTNGSPAWYAHDANGWVAGEGGKGSPNFQLQTTSPAAPGAPGAPGAAAPSTDLGSLVNPDLGGFGSLMQPYGQQFTAPTDLTEQNDPGYQARLALGTDALQRSAAARGGVLTGGTAKALDTYAQDYASNEYGNVYNRALNTFNSNYNQYNQNQTNQYNRLASLAGIGQQTAQQLGSLGQQTAQGVSSNLLGTAQSMGQDYQNAGAANASGYYNTAQSINNGIGGSLNALSQYNQLQQLQQMQHTPIYNSSPSVYGGGSLYGV
jgi:hypothetical protein